MVSLPILIGSPIFVNGPADDQLSASRATLPRGPRLPAPGESRPSPVRRSPTGLPAPNGAATTSGNSPHFAQRHGNQLTRYQPASYTARRYEFAQSYVVSRDSERLRPDALEIFDCGIEPG